LVAALVAAPGGFPASLRAAPPPGCAVVQPGAANTSGDWEASFGRRALHRRAVALLNRVHALGFRCAVIEREQHTYDVAVIGLSTPQAANKVVARAHRLKLAAQAVRS
jgi:hypothetical protein